MSFKKVKTTLPKIKIRENIISLLSANQITTNKQSISFNVTSDSEIISFSILDITSFEVINIQIFIYTKDGSIFILQFLSYEETLIANDRINSLLNGGIF